LTTSIIEQTVDQETEGIMSISAINAAMGEEVMTDFQFKAIMTLVLEMLDKCKTIEEYEKAKKAIAALSVMSSGAVPTKPTKRKK
jgi:hypothetical protein